MADETVVPIVNGTPAPQTVLAAVASTAEQAIAGATEGAAVYEFVADGCAHINFGTTGVGAADTTHALVTQTPRRFLIHSAKATHLRAIRGARETADVRVSFSRVR